MQFIIIHGSFGSPAGNWFPWLKQELEQLHQIVYAPQFPVDDYNHIVATSEEPQYQTLKNWLATFAKVIEIIDPNQPVCIAAHSIGSVFTLHAVEKFNLQIDSTIFVAPFLYADVPDVVYQKINSDFYKRDFDFTRLMPLIPVSYTVYSPTDPYVQQRYSLEFANKLQSETIVIEDGGHLNAETGYIKFPLLLELCKTRI